MKTSDKIALSAMMLNATLFLRSEEIAFLIFFVIFVIAFCIEKKN